MDALVATALHPILLPVNVPSSRPQSGVCVSAGSLLTSDPRLMRAITRIKRG